MKKAILLITDGVGYSAREDYNAFFHAKKPHYDYLFKNVPYCMIKTYGDAVGLPSGQMGNSEVGHMCMGSGRVLYQNLVRITKSIEDGSMLENPALRGVLENSNVIHISALMSDGGVHSHIFHLISLAKICALASKDVWLHLITDGRDVLPQSAIGFLAQLSEEIKFHPSIKIATLSGRFYAMDRDKRWDRVKSAYEVLTQASSKTCKSPKEYIEDSYSEGVFDEFIKPVAFGEYEGMSDNEGFIFVNFRSDRAREIVDALGNADFNAFTRQKYVKLHIATMCEYDENFKFPVFFKKEEVKNTLAQVISRAGLRQFHTAETEKYAHVTFFFNGGVEGELAGEVRKLIPSPQVKTYDLKPEMSAKEVCDAVLGAINDEFDFIVVNFANGDMVGHTGDYNATIKAVEALDEQIGRILELARQKDYALIITSDHGNCEQMQDEEGNILTNHTIGDVWCFVVDERVKALKDGGLNNIAPTILKLMGLDIPEQMDEALF